MDLLNVHCTFTEMLNISVHKIEVTQELNKFCLPLQRLRLPTSGGHELLKYSPVLGASKSSGGVFNRNGPFVYTFIGLARFRNLV